LCPLAFGSGDASQSLAHCDFKSAYNQSWCKSEQARFVEQYGKSLAGDYKGQKSVAECLANGCSGAVTVDKVQACAWRLVILVSGSKLIDTSDDALYRAHCLGLDNLANQRAIHTEANDLMLAIYNRPLPAVASSF
jgi:hypothetical protein